MVLKVCTYVFPHTGDRGKAQANLKLELIKKGLIYRARKRSAGHRTLVRRLVSLLRSNDFLNSYRSDEYHSCLLSAAGELLPTLGVGFSRLASMAARVPIERA